jgi:deoxyadenosine/deoxycytidine kinase
MNHYFITIAGNIGVGKSTLVKLLTARSDWSPVYEAVAENPYLADFYQDMPRWAFHSQIFFLSRRLQQHYALQQQPRSIIQDRSVYEDAEIFARNLYVQKDMTARDWETYYELYRTTVGMLRPPHLVIYLQASVPTLVGRIKMRGRDFEQDISADYLQRLNSLYEEWVEQFNMSPVLTINTDNLDYVQYEEHLEEIWQKISMRLRGRDFLTL